MDVYEKLIADSKNILGEEYDLSDHDLLIIFKETDKSCGIIIQKVLYNQIRSAMNRKVLTRAQRFKIISLFMNLMVQYLETISERIESGEEDSIDEIIDILIGNLSGDEISQLANPYKKHYIHN